MNDKEKRDFYTAMCKCCLLANAMKTCAECRFNIGLAEPVKPVDSIVMPISIQGAIAAISA